MSFARGLMAGLAISALQVAAAHSGLAYGPLSAERDARAIVLVILVPLSILWGWTWVSERYSGRSHPRMVGYTAALLVGAASAPIVERLAFGPRDESALLALAADSPRLLGADLVFLVPAFAVAAPLWWLFASGRLPARFLPLALGYLIGLPFALVYPPLAIGAVGGTAAGHAWRSPRSQTSIAIFVVVLVVVAALAPLVLLLTLGPDAPFPLAAT